MSKKMMIANYENVKCELPAGYEVRREGFQKNALYFGGKLLKVYERLVWAHNGAQRHADGGQL